jgi:TonB family protein
VSEYSISAIPLWASDPFRRWLGLSAGSHAFLFAVLIFGPGFGPAPSPPPVFVDLVAAAEPPAPKPRAKKQVVDEAIVIRKQPRALPKPKRKPEPKPEVAKPEPEDSPSPEEILAQLRAKVAKRSPAAAAGASGATGRPEDPELAAYKAQVMSCLYEHWAGARAFSRQSELEVQFEVRVGASGRVRKVSLARSSSNRYLDESAERAVWKCDPFEPPPRGVSEFNLTFNPADLV